MFIKLNVYKNREYENSILLPESYGNEMLFLLLPENSISV